MLPAPEIVRDWISAQYTDEDIASLWHTSRRIIMSCAENVAKRHEITNYDDILNLSYHIEDMMQEVKRG